MFKKINKWYERQRLIWPGNTVSIIWLSALIWTKLTPIWVLGIPILFLFVFNFVLFVFLFLLPIYSFLICVHLCYLYSFFFSYLCYLCSSFFFLFFFNLHFAMKYDIKEIQSLRRKIILLFFYHQRKLYQYDYLNFEFVEQPIC